MDGCRSDSVQESSQTPNSQALPEEMERKARMDAVWQQINKGVSAKSIKSMMEIHSSTVNKSSRNNSSQTSSGGWMGYLGLGSKKTPSPGQGIPDKPRSITQNGTSEDAKRYAAALLQQLRMLLGYPPQEGAKLRSLKFETLPVRKSK